MRSTYSTCGAPCIAPYFNVAKHRAFVEVFCQLGRELPRFINIVHTLENVDVLANQLDVSRREHEATVAGLKATIAKYQDAFADIEKLRAKYSRLQDDAQCASELPIQQ